MQAAAEAAEKMCCRQVANVIFCAKIEIERERSKFRTGFPAQKLAAATIAPEPNLVVPRPYRSSVGLFLPLQ